MSLDRFSASPRPIVPIRSISSPTRRLSKPGRAYSLGSTPFSRGLSCSMASIAASSVLPMVGCLASPCRYHHRASRGTQNTFSGQILVAVLRIRARLALERLMPLLKRVRDVLQEDQPENDMLVLGRVQIAAQLICCQPQRRFKAEVATPVLAFRALQL